MKQARADGPDSTDILYCCDIKPSNEIVIDAATIVIRTQRAFLYFHYLRIHSIIYFALHDRRDITICRTHDPPHPTDGSYTWQL